MILAGKLPADDSPHPNLDAAVDALPPLTDEECAALGDLLLAIRVGRARTLRP